MVVRVTYGKAQPLVTTLGIFWSRVLQTVVLVRELVAIS